MSIYRLAPLLNQVITADQKSKDAMYQEVISIRACVSEKFDAIGYNQLHWAVVLNQSVPEISRLLKNKNLDINSGCQYFHYEYEFNLPPLYFAILFGHRKIAECLLQHGADETFRIDSMDFDLNILIPNSHRARSRQENGVTLAFECENATFILFEKSFLENHLNTLLKSSNEYNSILPTFFASCLYHSNKEELETGKKLLAFYKTNPDDAELQQFAVNNPAVRQNTLGQIFNLSLKARISERACHENEENNIEIPSAKL